MAASTSTSIPTEQKLSCVWRHVPDPTSAADCSYYNPPVDGDVVHSFKHAAVEGRFVAHAVDAHARYGAGFVFEPLCVARPLHGPGAIVFMRRGFSTNGPSLNRVLWMPTEGSCVDLPRVLADYFDKPLWASTLQVVPADGERLIDGKADDAGRAAEPVQRSSHGNITLAEGTRVQIQFEGLPRSSAVGRAKGKLGVLRGDPRRSHWRGVDLDGGQTVAVLNSEVVPAPVDEPDDDDDEQRPPFLENLLPLTIGATAMPLDAMCAEASPPILSNIEVAMERSAEGPRVTVTTAAMDTALAPFTVGAELANDATVHHLTIVHSSAWTAAAGAVSAPRDVSATRSEVMSFDDILYVAGSGWRFAARLGLAWREDRKRPDVGGSLDLEPPAAARPRPDG